MTGAIKGTGMANRTNPTFGAGAVLIPAALFVGGALLGTIQRPTSVHVMAGVLRTRIDLFVAAVLARP